MTESTKEIEHVNHPNHYGGDTTYEAIKVIHAWELPFSTGNVVKYICRAGKKVDNDTLQDLKKAKWYLDDYIKLLSGEYDQPELAAKCPQEKSC